MTHPSLYITCAIDYVNSIPHLGTAYEKIGADFLARFYKMMGDDVLLQLGNDEHSVNVFKTAQKEGLDPKAYCDSMRPKFENTWRALGVDFDEFIQTSESRHHLAVKTLIEKIYQKGDIYKRNYQGWYCDSCEAFYTQKDSVDGLCVQHKKEPQWIEEENYFFKLSAYQDFLLKHIEDNPGFILPLKRKNEVVAFIKQGLQDISVSRANQSWGIELPFQKNHAVYVWFDALINYITGVGYPSDAQKFKKFWPAHLHVIGKDITRFHCVIWPAMLESSGLALPKSIFAHGFLNLKGEKMSKSLGNVVTPLDVLNEYPDFGADALRYYLLRTSSFGDDGDFTFEDFILRYNADLANGVGNLASRIIGMVWRYQAGQVVPHVLEESDKALLAKADSIFKAVHKDVDPLQGQDIDTHLALEKILGFVTAINQYIDEKQPWALAKNKELKKLSVILTTLVEAERLVVLLLAPFIPFAAPKIWQAFGFEAIQPFSSIRFNDLLAVPWIREPHTLKNEKLNLFPRIENKKEVV